MILHDEVFEFSWVAHLLSRGICHWAREEVPTRVLIPLLFEVERGTWYSSYHRMFIASFAS